MGKSKFKSTEISNPEFESNNLRFITVKTPNLKGRGDICVFVPPLKNLKDIPIVTLLHGVYASAWAWPFKTGVHLKAWDMMQKNIINPMVLVMPSDGLWGDGSAYLPHNGFNFEQWITEDVIEGIIENIDMTSNKSSLYISGLSMGGYGALRLGAKYHKKYKAISAHSSLTNIDQMHLFVEEDITLYNQSGKEETAIIEIMLKHKNKLPHIRFDCGKNDIMIAHNRLLHQQLEKAQVPHKFYEYDGVHEWKYWEKHIKDTLIFFNQFNN
ncbi:alpha/beta hydrolase [Wocania ichthyoenteri]|uniref:alpha/beta hydrolase n=1 Tax=Wocania ichthyoenteri TaxID=1230531 RepID=UPI00053ED9E2|nr:accessory Sec system protein Asp2 [Wocania ichthyoenteri]